MSIASWMSPPASALTFPISRVIRSASAGFSRSRSCAKRKSMFPRSGAGTRRQSSHAARAVATARSTSSAVERGNDSMSSPGEGLSESNVAVAIALAAILAGRRATAELRRARRVGAGKRSGDASAPAVADHAAVCGLVVRGAAAPPIGALAPVDYHRHVRVVAVVRDHLVVQLVGELRRDDAIDHVLSV